MTHVMYHAYNQLSWYCIIFIKLSQVYHITSLLLDNTHKIFFSGSCREKEAGSPSTV